MRGPRQQQLEGVLAPPALRDSFLAARALAPTACRRSAESTADATAVETTNRPVKSTTRLKAVAVRTVVVCEPWNYRRHAR